MLAPLPLLAQSPSERDAQLIDYLKFANGAVPIAISGDGARLGATFEHAVRIIDGDSANFTFVNRAGADTATEFTYQLPAATTFDRFAVPDIRETPSPNQTFARLVEVHGSPTSADGGYTLLASAALTTHATPGQVTEIPVSARVPVRWIKLRLVGGINVATPLSFFEFSDIVGNGRQDAAALVDHFRGAWQGRGATEGTDAYNQGLSERRAQAVVADLARRGLPASRVRAAGIGEARPIAGNNDENGRSMNRRVEVHCR